MCFCVKDSVKDLQLSYCNDRYIIIPEPNLSLGRVTRKVGNCRSPLSVTLQIQPRFRRTIKHWWTRNQGGADPHVSCLLHQADITKQDIDAGHRLFPEVPPLFLLRHVVLPSLGSRAVSNYRPIELWASADKSDTQRYDKPNHFIGLSSEGKANMYPRAWLMWAIGRGRWFTF